MITMHTHKPWKILYLIPYPECELWKNLASHSKTKPKHPTSFSIHPRQPTASYHDSFQGKTAESCPKHGYNVDYQGTNIWHQTYKFNTSLKLRAYSHNTYKLDEQTYMIKAKLIGSRRPYRRKITHDLTHWEFFLFSKIKISDSDNRER